VEFSAGPEEYFALNIEPSNEQARPFV
jgi:hypothetical protein